MDGKFSSIIGGVDAHTRALRELIPDVVSAFGDLSSAAQRPGALDRNVKELIALAIAVSERCEACIGYHARTAARIGVSRQEAAEAVGVAVQMSGGPALNFAAEALAAFDEFRGGAQSGATSHAATTTLTEEHVE